MTSIALLERLALYGASANGELLAAAAPLPDAKLDQPFPIGLGSLRLVLQHTLVGEEVWLARWRGIVEHPWGDDETPQPVSALAARFGAVSEARLAFIRGLSVEQMDRIQPYRDSRGTLFAAKLGDMLLQGMVHSIHHRAQAANILRQLGCACPDMDYMMHVREAV